MKSSLALIRSSGLDTGARSRGQAACLPVNPRYIFVLYWLRPILLTVVVVWCICKAEDAREHNVVSPLEEWIVNIRYRDRGNEEVVLQIFLFLFFFIKLDFRSDYLPFQREDL